MDHKVTVVGAGFVGATCARRIVEQNLADVVLVDIMEGYAEGKALDIMQAAPIEGYSTKIVGSDKYDKTENSDVIVITAGLSRQPGMTRDDLLKANAKVVGHVAEETSKRSPEAVIVTVTNPLDVMTYLTYKRSGFDSKKVVGMAGILDSARYRWFIAEEMGVVPSQIQAMVLGGHGDSMVPLPRFSTVNGISITELLPEDKIEAINTRVKNGGAEIVNLLKKGSAYYAPSAAAVEMVKSLLYDEKKILPCSAYLSGEYEMKDLYCGVPVRLGKKGIEEVIELDLTEKERSLLQKSGEGVKSVISQLEI
ncbi:malate dehydrogenase [PVC group bacterium (ex Bugula neritina AB1)]|nr:malate dehydrogenase [PVC group bacterium (ex Bugula neritina AB1)]